MLEQLTRRKSEEAWNQDLRRRVQYYRLLCGESMELIEAEASQLGEGQPLDVYSAFPATFARWRLGKTADLASCLPLLSQPHAWKPGERAALHAIFRTAGDAAAAESFRQGIPEDIALFAEEMRLLAGPK